MTDTLIFVDIPADDPSAAATFYAEVFGWRNDPKPEGLYHRMVPGGQFMNPDGTESLIGNLHIGIFKADNARPHPDAGGTEPKIIAQSGRKPRIWLLIGDDDTAERILTAACARGAKELWRDHYWSTFNGYNHAFMDPWGNEIILWGKAGQHPDIPDSYTRE
ncbi:MULTISPECIES: VOC family protein [Acetobacter]|uniref:VOC family protein n=1 Tax=Acetobacter TaxID=434 RepID=UPI000A38A605|nr:MULTISPECIES: VOC family protein [Acetobacter]MBS0961257.1 VOC family protein [Acetobacter thailandicus]OUJ11276.1 glyoxalase [Acetobacter sp. DsW_059]